MEHKRQRVQFRWVCLKPRMKGPDLHDSWRGQADDFKKVFSKHLADYLRHWFSPSIGLGRVAANQCKLVIEGQQGCAATLL